EDRPGPAIRDRRGRPPHGLPRHPPQKAQDRRPRQLLRQLHPLRRARARPGCGPGRHGPARRDFAPPRPGPRVHRPFPPRPPAIRLSAIMGQRVVYVMTPDPIGLAEDGPPHQPVEHLAGLRAMPNLNVFRPADPIETAECWELALAATTTPSILALTRQAVPQ